jgi:NitT/TauT family transport system substrate-binding protein
VISRLEFRAQIRVIADARCAAPSSSIVGRCRAAACTRRRASVLRYPNTVQALANAIVRALKWLQTAGPSDIVRAVPESAMSGDRAIYLSALDKVREAFSPDGLISEPAVMTAHELVARHVPRRPRSGRRRRPPPTPTNSPSAPSCATGA